MKRINWRGIEIKVLIEFASRIVDRMNQHGPDANDIGSLLDSLKRIKQKSFPQSFALFPCVHGKTSQQHNADGMVREAFGDSVRTFVFVDGSRRESVITHHPIVSQGNVNPRGVRLLVRPSESPQPVRQRRIAAIERRAVVFTLQLPNQEVRSLLTSTHARFAT